MTKTEHDGESKRNKQRYLPSGCKRDFCKETGEETIFLHAKAQI